MEKTPIAYSKKVKTPYWAIWRISGDGGVSDRGTYILQTDNLFLIKKLCEYCGDLCDDRCTAEVISTNVSYQQIEKLDTKRLKSWRTK